MIDVQRICTIETIRSKKGSHFTLIIIDWISHQHSLIYLCGDFLRTCHRPAIGHLPGKHNYHYPQLLTEWGEQEFLKNDIYTHTSMCVRSTQSSRPREVHCQYHDLFLIWSVQSFCFPDNRHLTKSVGKIVMLSINDSIELEDFMSLFSLQWISVCIQEHRITKSIEIIPELWEETHYDVYYSIGIGTP